MEEVFFLWILSDLPLNPAWTYLYNSLWWLSLLRTQILNSSYKLHDWIPSPYYFQGGCCKVCGEVTHLARHCPNKGKQDLISSRDDGKRIKKLLNVSLHYENCFFTHYQDLEDEPAHAMFLWLIYILNLPIVIVQSVVSRQVFCSIVMVHMNMDHILVGIFEI